MVPTDLHAALQCGAQQPIPASVKVAVGLAFPSTGSFLPNACLLSANVLGKVGYRCFPLGAGIMSFQLFSPQMGRAKAAAAGQRSVPAAAKRS
jgi:hypothetical protein